MNVIVRWISSLFAETRPVGPPRYARINIPRSLLHALRRLTTPTLTRHEPLAFLQVRFASEDVRDVIVGIGVIPFATEAYVEGDAGANFDTRWLVQIANNEICSNTGLLLVHSHGGRGRPNFSSTDRATNLNVMGALSIGVDVAPYGSMVLSDDNATAVVACTGRLRDAKVVEVTDRLGGLDLSA